MKLTNKNGMPEPLVVAVGNDSYTKGDADISVTELLTPPQLRQLRIKHDHELEEDVTDRMWSLLGQGVHHIIERAGLGLPASLNEATVYSVYDGWKVKGQIDHVALDNGTLFDFKVTSVAKVRGGIPAREWVQQTNIYRRLLSREKGLEIGGIAVIAILRDWSRNQLASSTNYPPAPAMRFDIPLWDADEADAFIARRIGMHQTEVPDPCTEEEVWARPERFAVMKGTNKRAIRVYDNEEEAQMLASVTKDAYVEVRPGMAVRCQSWCPVARFCPQWQADPRRKISEDIMETMFNA